MADSPVMTDDASILADVKKSLGLADEDGSFDTEILMDINSAIATLRSNGAGNGLLATDKSVWGDLKDPSKDSVNKDYFGLAIQYIFVDVKIVFDPPMASSLDALKEVERQLIWRINVEYSNPYTPLPEGR